MKKTLIYFMGESGEVWISLRAFAKSRELNEGSIRNSMSKVGYWRGRDGGVLRWKEVMGEDLRSQNRFALKGKRFTKVDEGDLPGFG